MPRISAPPSGLGLKSNSAVANGTIAVSKSKDIVYLTVYKSVVILAGGSQGAPLSYSIPVPRGTVQAISAEFPSGCCGLVGVRLYHLETQVFPLPAGEWLRSDDAIITTAITTYVNAEPPQVILECYNEDDTFSHRIWIAIEIKANKKDVSSNLIETQLGQ